MGKNSTKENRAGKPPWQGFVGPILAVVLVLLLVQVLMVGNGKTEVKYGEFKRLLREDKIRSVTLGPTLITGELKEPSHTKDRREYSQFQVPRVGVENDLSLIPELEEHKVEYGAEKEKHPLTLAMIWFLPTLLFIGLFYFFILRRIGPGPAMSFSRSKAKLYAQEDVNVTFDDVAGIEEAVEELREVVDFLKTPEKYQAIGGRIPKGVLLVGSPGTGKTLLAKAVAGEADVTFFGLSGSDFVEMFVGVGAARVRDLFAQAEQRAPCIIFIDELDALGKARGAGMLGGHDEREQTLNQLLVEMDGFDSNRGVIIMGATNRPETLDQALLRPGRFDRTVVVDRPDLKGRESILKVHIRNVKVSEDLDLHAIAAFTSGFSGADLANLVNEAALLAAREGKPFVGKKHFEEAIERGIAGLERKTRVMTEEEKTRISYHECGHAIVGYLLPGSNPVHKISIIPRGVAALGYTLHLPVEDRFVKTQSELENKIHILLGGITAEEICFTDIGTGASNDLERATQIARSMVTEFGMSPRLGKVNYSEEQRSAFLAGSTGRTNRYHSEATAREIDEEVKRIINESSKLVREILEEHRQALETLAQRLLEKEVLSAEELKEVMDASSPRIVPTTAVARSGAPREGKQAEDPPASMAE